MAGLTTDDLQDIQGIVISGYGHLSCASYLLLRVSDEVAARRWLAKLAVQITTSERREEGVSTNVNVAFTHHGLTRLGLDADTLTTFSRPFVEGMATPHRSRILGDDDENAPANWTWGGDDKTKAVDILLLLFAVDEPTLDELLKQQRADFLQSGITEWIALGAGRQPDSHEHFGFADGIAQPTIEGSPQMDKALQPNVIKAGEVLLSHLNDYDKPADSPMVNPSRDPNGQLPSPPSTDGMTPAQQAMRDFGHNGTYLVFRQLAQDVAGFRNFLDKATLQPNGQIDSDASDRLAAKIVGRWPSGAPLVLSPNEDNPALGKENNFSYSDTDPHGFACPIGSHIRRCNPRDSLGLDPKEALLSANRHRLLRRGRSYGDRPKEPPVDDHVERGLHFICLNGDIERQFEFVQQTWINNPVFGGLQGEVDPLIGNLNRIEPPSDDPAGRDAIMTVQADPLRTRIHKLCSFVTVKGGAYFFLPSMKALRYLSSL